LLHETPGAGIQKIRVFQIAPSCMPNNTNVSNTAPASPHLTLLEIIGEYCYKYKVIYKEDDLSQD